MGCGPADDFQRTIQPDAGAVLLQQIVIGCFGESAAAPYAEFAAELKMTEGALKVAVHRLRRRYRELLRAEIAQTVAHPGEIDEEIRELFKAISP